MDHCLKPIFITSIFVLTATFLHAQQSDCINFSDNIAQGTYGTASGLAPGDTLFTDDGVVISLEEFLYLDGTTGFINATVSDDPIFNGDLSELIRNDYIFPSNINLHFDFRAISKPVIQVCFNFADGGGEENLAVNGQEILVLTDFLGLDGQEITPGVTASLTIAENLDFPAGTLCLNGTIESLVVGGQELVLDKVCFCTEECRIKDFKVFPMPCTPNNVFFANIEFEVQAPGGSYFVEVGEETFGPFDYGTDEFPVLGPFAGNGSRYEFTIRDADNPDCKAWTTIGPMHCTTECLMEDLFAYVTLCEEGGGNCLNVDFDYDLDNPVVAFELYISDSLIGTFQSNELPLEIRLADLNIPADSAELSIRACATNIADCCLNTTVDLPCDLSNGSIDDLECIGDNLYRVTVDFDYAYTGGSFRLKTRGGFSEVFPYDILPLRIALPVTDDGYDRIKIIDQANDRCRTYIRFDLPCQLETCSIFNPSISNLECINDTAYRVTINFDHENTSDTFRLSTWGGFEATFNYDSLPLRITLPVPESGIDEFRISDLENQDCFTELEFEVACQDTAICSISNGTIDNLECIGDGMYRLTVDFNHDNTGDRFLLKNLGGFQSTFSYDSLPLRIALPVPEDGLDELTICDTQDNTCGTTIEFDLPCTLECNISNLSAEPIECQDGVFWFSVTFDAGHTGNSGYYIFVDGQIFGPFSYAQTTREVGPFTGDSSTVYNILLLDIEDPACFDYIEVDSVNCAPPPDPCRIFDLSATALECDSVGNFDVSLKFAAENGSDEGFRIFGNGEEYGAFGYALDSIVLGPFAGDDETIYEFIFQDLQDAACQSEVVLGPVACTEEVWPGDANNNGRADHFDLLNIGLAFGGQGPGRSVPGNDWQGFDALSWDHAFADGVNMVYADCNGDGVINALDKEAIELNFGLTNGPVQPVTQLPGNDLDPPIFVDLPDNSGLPEGLPFTVPVVLGSDENIVENVYGIAFTVKFDPNIINPASIDVGYFKSWLGEEFVDLITFDRVDAANGEIHIAISRTDQVPVSGFGVVAFISGIIDDIAGRVISEVKVIHVRAIKNDQQVIPLSTPVKTFELKGNTETPSELDVRLGLRIVPNPVVDEVQILSRYDIPIHSVQIFDADGRPVRQPETNTDHINVKDLPKGIYLLRIKIGEYVIHEKVVKI